MPLAGIMNPKWGGKQGPCLEQGQGGRWKVESGRWKVEGDASGSQGRMRRRLGWQNWDEECGWGRWMTRRMEIAFPFALRIVRERRDRTTWSRRYIFYFLVPLSSFLLLDVLCTVQEQPMEVPRTRSTRSVVTNQLRGGEEERRYLSTY